MPKKDKVSTTEILEFLKDHMVMKEDLDDRFEKFEGKMDQKFNKHRTFSIFYFFVFIAVATKALNKG